MADPREEVVNIGNDVSPPIAMAEQSSDSDSGPSTSDESGISINLHHRLEPLETDPVERRLFSEDDILKERCWQCVQNTFRLCIYGPPEPSMQDEFRYNLAAEQRRIDVTNCFGLLPPEHDCNNCFGFTPWCHQQLRSFCVSRDCPAACLRCPCVRQLEDVDGAAVGRTTPQTGGLGALAVVIPMLSLFGAILFLRLTMIVGNAGIVVTCLMFTIGYAIITITTFSFSAISTNGVMKGGGPYFMISRVLGPEMGGSIGFIFFLAVATGGCLYFIGFLDSLIDVVPSITDAFGSVYATKVILGSGILLVIVIVCLLGSPLFSKVGLFFFACFMFAIFIVAISLVFLGITGEDSKMGGRVRSAGYTGMSRATFVSNLWPYVRPNAGMKVEKVVEDTVVAAVDNCTRVIANATRCVFAGNSHCSVVWPDSSWFEGGWGVEVDTGEVLNFRSVFTIFFPACCGVLAGANLSGDLKNPSRDIPRGTILAIIVTYIWYIGSILLIGFTLSREALVNDYLVLSKVSLFSTGVRIGILAATLNCCMTSLIGASRLLHAIASDNLLPFFGLFSVGKEGRVAVVGTYLLIQGLLFIGSIGGISRFVTLFCIWAYLFVNFTCFVLSLTNPPNFRPRFKFSSVWTAGMGVVLTIFMMFFLQWWYTLIITAATIVVVIIIHFYHKPKPWGDIMLALQWYFSRKCHASMNKKMLVHVKFWRFAGLVCMSNPRNEYRLLQFIDNLSSVRGGLAICGHVKLFSEGGTASAFRHSFSQFKKDLSAMDKIIAEANLSMFVEFNFAGSVRAGIQNLMLSAGMGRLMKPNIVILGFCDPGEQPFQVTDYKGDPEIPSLNLFSEVEDTSLQVDVNEWMDIIKDILLLEKSLILTRNFQKLERKFFCPTKKILKRLFRTRKPYTIDLWMIHASIETMGKENQIQPSVSLMLQLASLLRGVSIWKKHHRMRILRLVNQDADDSEVESERQAIADLLELSRVDAKIKIVKLLDEDFPSDLRKKEVSFSPRNMGEEREGENISRAGDFLSAPTIDITVTGTDDDDGEDAEEGAEGQTTPVVGNLGRRLLMHSPSISLIRRDGFSFDEFTVPLAQYSSTVITMPDGSPLSGYEEARVMCRVVRRNSASTSIAMMPLPPPPSVFNDVSHEEYWKELDALTFGRTPIMLVYSRENVISTQL